MKKTPKMMRYSKRMKIILKKSFNEFFFAVESVAIQGLYTKRIILI